MMIQEKTSFLQFAFIKGTNLQILHSQGTQKKWIH